MVPHAAHQPGPRRIEAADGVEALGLLQNVDDIALLVSDTVMPGGIGGRELAATCARTLRPQLPILLVTGYASEATLTDGFPADAPTLRKFFDQAALAGMRWRPCSGPEPGAAAGSKTRRRLRRQPTEKHDPAS